MNMELRRINAMRRQLLDYFDQYVENNTNPSIQRVLEFIAVEEELEDELLTEMREETEQSLRKDFL